MKKNQPRSSPVAIVALLVASFSCTDLDVKVYDKTPNFWRNEKEIIAGVAPAYVGLRSCVRYNGIYALNEASTDEIIVPNRISDWNDNGSWEPLWKHTWQTWHPFVENAWLDIYGGIIKINNILNELNELKPEDFGQLDSEQLKAELKTVRAYYYYLLLDLYGNVPIVDVGATDLAALDTKSRTEVFNFVEKEIKENIENLKTDAGTETYGRATQWFAHSILAKLYVNAQVFTGSTRWQDCIASCDAIINSGYYSLESDFFSNFSVNNESSHENIFVVPFDRVAGLETFWIQVLTLHYNSPATFGLQGSCVNGFCSTAEYYNLFEANDIRRNMFLVGQQYKNQIVSPENLQYDRQGNLLIFDPLITSFIIQPPKTETAGARCAKWEFNKQGSGLSSMSNDFAVFRLADIILVKAEAQFRDGDAAGAMTTINQKYNGVSIRSRAGLTDFGPGEMNLEGLLAERARELSWEGHRRNDLVRFGHFTDARVPEKEISETYRTLYPIPQSVLDNNGNLEQNPGYSK